MGLVSVEEWDAEWLQKSNDLEEDLDKAEKTMARAERDYAMAMKDQPSPSPGPAPRGAVPSSSPRWIFIFSRML